MRGPAVTAATLGAWLVKARPDGLPLAELVDSGFADLTSRCVRPSYRTDLVAAGQPVLLWVSGQDPQHPAGIYASGHTTGPVEQATELTMPLRLQPVEPFVARTDLLADGASGTSRSCGCRRAATRRTSTRCSGGRCVRRSPSWT